VNAYRSATDLAKKRRRHLLQRHGRSPLKPIT
jgi:hypothetical protein